MEPIKPVEELREWAEENKDRTVFCIACDENDKISLGIDGKETELISILAQAAAEDDDTWQVIKGAAKAAYLTRLGIDKDVKNLINLANNS